MCVENQLERQVDTNPAS